ncbi:Mediator of RNA polymerase II transcription subunit 24 [Labeo rohita]|uniref:Mediator of RNA polymerase II transcription subunit 24 n=1 Tax=Labeo rohita TaxID=84645 RepID=A0ABQ8LHY7_LABRO|nr:Mediator of RNA polymerase II transcription subunit 24 [Labeo rohita]
MCWSAQTTRRLWHTSTTKVVYAPFACHNSCSGASTDSSFCVPLTFRATSLLQGEWRLHLQTVQLIWSRFSQAKVDLFASPESTHCLVSLIAQTLQCRGGIQNRFFW